MVISNEEGGFYCLSSSPLENPSCNSSVIKCFVSKLACHSRLGDPTEQALNVLKDTLNFSNKSVPPCEICHKAK